MSTREQRGWYFYDWANSAFYTIVVTLFFGPYLTALAQNAAGPGGYVYPLGIRVDARSWWPYMLAAAVVLQIAVLPLVGAVTDRARRKRALLAGFTFVGAAASLAMYFLEGSRYFAGGVLFVVSNLAYGASMVVYNAFLPLIARPEERDAVSAKGWGIGYLGGGLALSLVVLLLQRAGALGLSEAHAVRISLGFSGLWWAVFTVIPLAALRDREPPAETAASGFRQLYNTLRDLRRYPQALWFLAAYLIYNDPIQAVIALASQFGSDELKMPMAALSVAILMVQFVAFPGALLFSRVAAALGAKRALMASLAVWTAALLGMRSLVNGATGFFVASFVVALVLGGSQALSRSLFSQLIPKGREAEYFGLYEISDKGTSWLAPLIFALAMQTTGSYRTSILPLAAMFVVGIFVLARVDVERGAREASGT